MQIQGFKPRGKFEVSIEETKFANSPGGAAEKKGEKQATVADMEGYTFTPEEVAKFQVWKITGRLHNCSPFAYYAGSS